MRRLERIVLAIGSACLLFAAGLAVLTFLTHDSSQAARPCNCTATVTTTVTTTVATTTTLPAPLFRDDFSDAIDQGVQRTVPNPANWIVLGGDGADCIFAGQNDWCADASLAYVDANGYLVLEGQKVAGFADDRRAGRTVYYKTGAVLSFSWDGWPPRTVLQSFGPGTRLDVRAKLAAGNGTWSALWTDGVNRPSSAPGDDHTEFDVQEELGNAPNVQRCSIHERFPPDGTPWDSTTNLGMSFDGSAAFHDYWLEYRSDRVVMGVDGLTCRSTLYSSTDYNPAANGELMGMLLFSQFCDSSVPDSTGETCWNGNSVDASTVFPTRMLIDYVQVSALAG